MQPPADSPFTCLVSATLHDVENRALLQGGHDPAEFAVLTVGIGGLNIGLAADPRTGQAAWVFQCEAALEGDALTVRQSAILDANGGATSRALAAALPIGGTVRLAVRRSALHPALLAKLDPPEILPPRLDLGTWAVAPAEPTE
jgi:hypothetical protein